MALDDRELARTLVDVDVPRAELVRLSRGLTPARLARVVALLDPVELMFALKKLRARRRPANQAHVTNLKENPALLAADAAEAALRGFAEMETTVGVSRYAPLNAIALLVGSQTGRPGVMTQCAIEERRNLQLAIQGLVTYAETLSVYGTEPVFVDGDDTPWSKAFLASAYASRGRQGALHLRRRLGGADGPRAGLLDALPRGALPRAPCARPARRASRTARSRASRSRSRSPRARARSWPRTSSPPGSTSRSPPATTRSPRTPRFRKTAKLMGQFLPGTDFVTSGYSVMPRHDNMFGGGNYDADDLDEWLTTPARLAGRRRHRAGRRGRGRARRASGGARAIQAVFDAFGFPPVTDEEVRGGDATRYDSDDLPDRDRSADVAAADRVLAERITGADVALALDRRGFSDVAEAIVGMQRQRVAADYLQTSAVIDAGRPRCTPRSTTRTSTPGPGTGWRLEGERWELLQALPARRRPALARRRRRPTARRSSSSAREAEAGDRADEVVIAVGPGLGDALRETINGLAHERGAAPRSPRACARAAPSRGSSACAASSDVAFIGHDGAAALRLGSGGRRCSRRARRSSTAPTCSRSTTSSSSAWRRSYTLESYRAIGRNAAGYALGQPGRPGADAPGQLRPREADRQDDAAARAARRRRSSRARPRSSSSSLLASSLRLMAEASTIGPDDTGGDEHRVTALELFFDLAIVFVFTQMTSLVVHDPTWGGVFRGMLVLAALWWAWVGYAWFTSTVYVDEGGVRLAMLAAMAAMLFVALAAPWAFGGRRCALRARVLRRPRAASRPLRDRQPRRPRPPAARS